MEAIQVKQCDVRRSFVVAALVAGLLAACVSQAPRSPPREEQRPEAFPEAFYLQSAARGHAVFQIEPALSLVAIEVRRAGSLARLGHDHVVASHDLHGYVAPDEGRADLYVRLDALVVDEPDLRARAAFDTQPSEAAIAGTRENMLAQLHAEEHPYALIHAQMTDADANGPEASVAITVNGITREARTAMQIGKADARLDVSGSMSLAQSDFGITPLSILGGALQVQDRVELHFAIRATRLSP
jgi:hypothetical protein